MPYIKVDIKKLNQYLQTVENVRAITGSAADQFRAISGSIDPNVRQTGGIDGQLRRIEDDLYRHQRVMANMTAFLDNAQQKYRLLSNYDDVGNADVGSGAAYVAPSVAATLQTQEKTAADGFVSSAITGNNTEIQASAARKTELADVGSATVVSAAVHTVSQNHAQKETSGDDYKAGNYASDTASGSTAQPAATPVAGLAVPEASDQKAEEQNKLAAQVASIADSATELSEMDQAQVFALVASTLNVAAEDLLKGIESGAYELKDIVECLEGKATDVNKFIQNASDTLRTLTGTGDIRFEQKDGHWIVSGFERDSWANGLVKIFHDGTGIGTRYNEDTLENTPVLGMVFQVDQLAEKTEKIAETVQKAADAVDSAVSKVTAAVEIADYVRERANEAAGKIEKILADESKGKDEKIAATQAIVGTTCISTAMDVSSPYAGQTVNAVVSKLVGDKSGDETLGKEVGKVAEKLVTGGMELVSDVITSDEVVNQVTESNLEINNTIKSECKTIGEAGKKILESDSVGEAIQNVGNLAKVVGKSGVEVVSTVVTEGAAVIYTVAKETAIATVDKVGDAIQAGCQTVAQNVKNEYETLKGFKDQIVGGADTVLSLAGETISVMKSNDDVTLGEAIALAAKEMGISKADIHDSINKGLCTAEDIYEYLEGKATDANGFVKQASSILRTVSGATDMVFKNKDGYVIVSEFTRNGWTNTLVKTFNDGTGIGTRYKPETLKDTPVIGTLYKADQAIETMDKLASGVEAVVTGVTGVIETGKKINDIWEDDTLTKKEKIYDTAAVAITGVVATALDVAAPFAGAAVKTAVAGAISAVLPGVGPVIGNAVGAVAGKLVENGMELVSDVITSEAVVNQVSDSLTQVGDTVASEVKAVSDAGKKLLESDNAKEAIQNTAALVGTAVTSGAKVVATAVTEGAKVAVTVVAETAKAVGEAVVSKAKAVGETAKKVADTAVEAAKKVGDAVVAGTKVVADAAKEAAANAAKALEEAKEAAKRKAEQIAREAEEKARLAAQKAAEEIKRKAEEAKRIAEETARKAAEAAKRAAEEAKRKAEEAARKVAEEAKRKAEAVKRAAEEAARKVAEAKRKAEEEARKKAEAAKKAAEAAAKKAAEAAKKAAEAAKKKAQEAAKKAAEAAKKAAEKAKKALSKW